MQIFPTVDKYVSNLIKKYNEEFNMNIHVKKPSKESRLELALKLDESKSPTERWEAMEIMTGRKIGREESTYGLIFISYILGMMSKEELYGKILFN